MLKVQYMNDRIDAAESLMLLGECEMNAIGALVALLKDSEGAVRDSAAKAIGKLGQACQEWTDKQMIEDLADDDSSVRERAGIVLAYRQQKVNSEPAPEEKKRLIDIRIKSSNSATMRAHGSKQAALLTLYHIEKRKAQLEEESGKARKEKSTTD